MRGLSIFILLFVLCKVSCAIVAKIEEKLLSVTIKSILPVGIGCPRMGGEISAYGTLFLTDSFVDLKMAEHIAAPMNVFDPIHSLPCFSRDDVLEGQG